MDFIVKGIYCNLIRVDKIDRYRIIKENHMRTIQIKISETDFQKFNLGSEEIKFTELVEMISREYARKSLMECNEIAEQIGLSKMTMEEIDAEVKAVRDAKTHT